MNSLADARVLVRALGQPVDHDVDRVAQRRAEQRAEQERGGARGPRRSAAVRGERARRDPRADDVDVEVARRGDDLAGGIARDELRADGAGKSTVSRSGGRSAVRQEPSTYSSSPPLSISIAECIVPRVAPNPRIEYATSSERSGPSRRAASAHAEVAGDVVEPDAGPTAARATERARRATGDTPCMYGCSPVVSQ